VQFKRFGFVRASAKKKVREVVDMAGYRRNKSMLRVSATALGMWFSTAFAATDPLSIETLIPLAQTGSVDAQVALGDLYGIQNNYQEAIRWYRLAAEQDESIGQFKLALAISNAPGVGRDYAEAARWYRQAAGHGIPEAQNNLGVMYGRGQGVPQNVVYAYMWYLVSTSTSADNPALQRRNGDIMQRDMGDEQRKRARSMADRCIATMFKECGDVLPPLQITFGSLKTAAENGNGDAQFKLAETYDSGLGITK
jgi:TPR repeat protein